MIVSTLSPPTTAVVYWTPLVYVAVTELSYLKITTPEPPAPPVAVLSPGDPPPPLPVFAVAAAPLLAPE